MQKLFVVYAETSSEPLYQKDSLVIPLGAGESMTTQVTDAELIEQFKNILSKKEGKKK